VKISTLVSALLLLLVSSATASDMRAPATTVVSDLHPSRPTSTDEDALPARQGHVAPVVFSMDPGEHPRIDHFLEQYSSNAGKKGLQIVLNRAAPYLPYIRERARYHDVPPELAYLPVIESGFDSAATSRSGAAGFWQFMMNSIAPFGLRVDSWVDERRDFMKATDAAFLKLKENYRATGDWLLAAAAYNCGLGCVTRTIEATGIRDYWALVDGGHLRPETADYVPKLLAAVTIASNPGRYGLELSWDPAPAWKRVETLPGQPVDALAQAAEIPPNLLRSWNRELMTSVTPPYPYFLKVPAGYAEKLEEAVAALPKDGFYVHLVRSGDTLYALSRHFGVTVTSIRRYNDWVAPSALRPGMTLYVPKVQDVGPMAPVEQVRQTGSRSSDENDYVVQRGDSLWGIARAHGLRVEELAEANGLPVTGTIYAGQVLTIP
jgi:membrane-bound lytic murein transglycosylase D